MTSTHLQNGNPECDNNNPSTTSINQKNTINSQQSLQQQQPYPNHLLNGYKVSSQRVVAGTAGVCNSGSVVGAAGVGSGVGEANFEGLGMNRKITLNGGNELRIDEKNISLHLNNPFVTNYVSSSAATSAAPVSASGASQPGYAVPHSSINNVIRNPSFKGSEQSLEYDGYSSSGGGNDVGGAVHRPARRPHSIAVSSPMNNNNNHHSNNKLSNEYSLYAQPGVMTTPNNIKSANGIGPLQNPKINDLNKEPIYAHMYGQFKNSPQRMQSRSTQEFSLYTPPSPISNMQQQPVNVVAAAGNGMLVQRRSHSTPRPIQSIQQQQQTAQLVNGAGVGGVSVAGGVGVSAAGIVQRPRSLDRCNGINTIDKNYKPPIPSRRLSQSGIAGAPLTPSTRAPSIGMRQSATFHGQLNRQTGNYGFPVENGNGMVGGVVGNGGGASDTGTRRKSDRPISYAYGTLPDQVFLENQLRIYSEQLRNITESVRKYSEQAKLLSEMKRQQMHKQQYQNMPTSNSIPIMKSDSSKALYQGGVTVENGNHHCNNGVEEPQTPSHQLKLFLDNIRSSMKDVTVENGGCMVEKVPDLDESIIEKQPMMASHETDSFRAASKKAADVPVKTPSDQLRQFLDAIRSNQVPEETDIKGACDRFHKFKEKVESSRPKSLHSNSSNSLDRYNSSGGISTSESFSQISDNLRIMNQDLEALAQKSPNKGALQKTEKQIMQFNKILDSFQQLSGNKHSIESVDYLRKCSEALRHTSDQLCVSTMNHNHSNGYGDSPDGSSCSTTPGSIREAVQNLLMQPGNGFQIMDDRMKLFIDILDGQEKFSQVRFNYIYFLYYCYEK